MFDTRPNREAEIALVGRSNVGKSTLMRELTGHSFDTGGKPGVTRSPNHYDWAPGDFVITDLPGFGFASGVDEDHREQIKTEIVHYLEEYADNVLVAILVVDGKSVIDIIDRHSGPDEIPYDVEMFHFLRDLDIPRRSSPSTRWTRSTTTRTSDSTRSVTASVSTHPGSSGRDHRADQREEGATRAAERGRSEPPARAEQGRSVQVLSEPTFCAACGRFATALGKTLMKSTSPSVPAFGLHIGRRPARSLRSLAVIDQETPAFPRVTTLVVLESCARPVVRDQCRLGLQIGTVLRRLGCEAPRRPRFGGRSRGRYRPRRGSSPACRAAQWGEMITSSIPHSGDDSGSGSSSKTSSAAPASESASSASISAGSSTTGPRATFTKYVSSRMASNASASKR